MKKFKKIFLGISSIACLAALASCDVANQTTTTVSEDEIRLLLAQESISAMTTIDKVYAETAEETETTETEETPAEETTTEGETTEDTTTEEEATTVDLEEITSLIARANILAENKVSITVEESDREGYIEKQTITYGDKVYVLYVATKNTGESTETQTALEEDTTLPTDMEGQMPTDMEGQMPTDMEGQMPTDMEGQMPGGFGGQGQMPTDQNGEMQMPTDMGGQMPGCFGGQGQMPTDQNGEMQMPTDMGGQMPGGFGGQGQMTEEMNLSGNKMSKSHKHHGHDDGDEVKYSGIIVYEGNEYEFLAKQETESDDECSKNKIRLIVTIDENTEVVIKVKDEVDGEDTETKFSCKYKVDGETTSKFSVKTETEDGEKKIKITEEGISYKLKYFTEDGVDYVKLYVKDTYKVLLSITTDEAGNTVYTVVEAE